MIAWMLYTLLAACLLAGAALAADEVARLLRRSRRWGWIVAMIAAAALPALFRLIPASPAPTAGAGVADADLLANLIASAPAADAPAGILAAIAGFRAADPFLLTLWLTAALTMLGALLVTYSRLRSVRAAAARVEIAGVPALLTRATGPMVVGVRRPEVVVPRWISTLAEGEQRLILRHEWEHVRAGDTRLLLASALLVAAMPWNVPLWWMRRRLRHAVEVDCDARVLAAGADRRLYGTMLIRTAGRPGPAPLLAPALVELPSLLERRIVAMTSKTPTHRGLRLGVVTTLGALLIAGACELTPRGGAPSPTEPTLADVVEGEVEPGESEVTRLEYVPMASRLSPDGVITHGRILPNGDTIWSESTRIRIRDSAGGFSGAEPLIYVNGVLTESMAAVNPNSIVSIDVLKGESALALYGADAKDGVVLVTTGDPAVARVRTPRPSAGAVSVRSPQPLAPADGSRPTAVVAPVREAPVTGATATVRAPRPVAAADGSQPAAVVAPARATSVPGAPAAVAVRAEDFAVQPAATAGELEGVVVVGYGTQARAGAAPSPLDSVVAVGYGTAARATTAPARASTFRLRSSDPAAPAPLILVDGRQVTSLESLDPSTIDSITVLKDRSATEMYGARGEHGVILIKLKR